MEKFRFLNRQVYRDAKLLMICIFKIINKIHKKYRFDLGSQVVRSAFSILLNIAEGKRNKSFH